MEATIVRSILDRGRQEVYWLSALELDWRIWEGGDQAVWSSKPAGALVSAEAVPIGVVNLLVISPSGVAQGVDFHDAVGVGSEKNVPCHQR